MKGRRGALELSIGTIVIIVLAMTMLILGIVLVRSIMCGAVGLTGEINTKVKGEINKLFQSTAGEVACVGGGEEPVTIIPGQINIIYCSIKAPVEAEYNIKTKSIRGDIISERELENWVSGDDFLKKRIAPGDEDPKKFLRLNVPENAPHDLITVEVEVYKDGNLISSPTLDFEVKRIGFFRAAIC